LPANKRGIEERAFEDRGRSQHQLGLLDASEIGGRRLDRLSSNRNIVSLASRHAHQHLG